MSKKGPNEKIVEMVESKGGAIWTGITDTVAGGAAVARTSMEQYRVPDNARMLLGWRPIDMAGDLAADESQVAVFDIAGVNFKFPPQEVICGNIFDSILTDLGDVKVTPSEYYDVFAPVNGGETLDVGVEPIDAIAGNRRSGAEFYWTNVKLDLPVIYSLCSREVALTAATAGIIAGTTLNVNNAHKLIEVGAIATRTVNTIEEELMADLILRCTVWDPVQEIRIKLEPGAMIANLATDTGACSHAGLTRSVQRIKFKESRATITADLDVDVAQTAAGQFVHMIRWI